MRRWVAPWWQAVVKLPQMEILSSPLVARLALAYSDPSEEMDLPGIVFRLSSLTITKALIRLDGPSLGGLDASLTGAGFVSGG